MVRYRWEVTVPPGTPQGSAVTNTIRLDERRLLDGLLFAPPGSAGRVNAEILWGQTRLLPTEDSTPRLLPGTTDPAPINTTVRGDPYKLTLRAWAPTTVRPHTVTARVDAVEDVDGVQDVRVTELPGPPQRRSEADVPTAEDIMSAGDDG